MQYHYIGKVSLPFADRSFWSLTWIWIEKGFEQVLVSDNCEWLMDSRWWRGISEWFPERPLYSGAHRLKRVMQEEMHPRESFPSTRPLMLHAPPPDYVGVGVVQPKCKLTPSLVHIRSITPLCKLGNPSIFQQRRCKEQILKSLYFYSQIGNKPPPDWVIKQLFIDFSGSSNECLGCTFRKRVDCIDYI